MTSIHNTFVSCIIYLDAMPDPGLFDFFSRLDVFLTKKFSAHEIILVNDSGRLLTERSLNALDADSRRSIVLLDLAYRHGLERAMLAGADLAVGDFVFEIDYPDPNLPTESLETVFVFAQTQGVDIVGGTSRLYQPTMSRFFYKLVNWLQVAQTPLSTEVVRVVSRRALNRTLAERRNIRYRKLLYSLSGFRYSQVDLGKVRISLPHKKSYRVALGLDLIASSSRFGSSAAAMLAFAFLLISMSLGIYALVVWFIGLPVAEGWTTIMGLLSLGLTGVFAVLSLVARMLSIVLDEVQ